MTPHGAEPVADAPKQTLLQRLFGRRSLEEGPKTPFLVDEDVVAAERYRTLAWKLGQVRARQTLQVLTITSSVASEGKSTVALNLATVLAERDGHRVLLIDADMRRPRLYDILGGGQLGFREVLREQISLDEALCTCEARGFAYLPTVQPADDALRLLSDSARLERVMTECRKRYDTIVVDAPPLLPVSDPLFLIEASDAFALVVRAAETSGRMLSRALAMVDRDKLLGLIFNGAERTRGYQYDPYYRRYAQKHGYRPYR